MLTKLFLIIVVPVFIGFFTGNQNIIDLVGLPIDTIGALLNQMAQMISVFCRLTDHILIEGTMLMLFRFVFLYEFAAVTYRVLQKILTWVQQ